MKKNIYVRGLDCAHCALTLEKVLQDIDGVRECNVNFAMQKIAVEVKSEKVLQQVKEKIENFEKVKILRDEADELQEKASRKKSVVCLIVSGVFLIFGVCLLSFADFGVWSILKYVAFGLAYLLVGLSVLKEMLKNLFCKNPINENFLMSVASLGAIVLGEYVEGVAVVWLYSLGEILQSLAVGRSRSSIKNLVNIRSEYANLLLCGEVIRVAPEDLRVGDEILVCAGEKIPVDCVILEGNGELDTKAITGEFLLREVSQNDSVSSGCINAGGTNLTLRVEKEYCDSTVAKILEMVENASDKKTRTEKAITSFARWYTPLICIMALLVAFVPPTVIWLVSGDCALAVWVKRALVLLVISCPCAIVISIPLAYFCAVGYSAKQGILVKGSAYFDVLAKTKTVAFDKTGTLTRGEFVIKQVVGEKTLDYVVAAEKGSSHPIATPFKQLKTAVEAKEISEKAGFGITCFVQGKKVLVGNAKLLKQNGVEVEKSLLDKICIFIAEEDRCIGYVLLDDEIKPDATDALKSLKRVGVSKLVLITGDSDARAQSTAKELGVLDEVCSDVLPAQKAEIVKQLKKEGSIVYVGDGINDVPVMAVADCAISMGKIGSASAIEASDVVVTCDNVKSVEKAIKIAKVTRSKVMQNLVFSLLAKSVFMILGVIGVLPVWIAVFADVGVMLLAVLNSARIKL